MFRSWNLYLKKKKKTACAESERIFNIILQSFGNHGIPISNILGICFDGCNTMSGWKTCLKARLQKEVPNIICITCLAHKTHLAAKHAMLLLPESVKKLLVKVYKMSNSSHNAHELELLQEKHHLPKHKILRLIEIRWLQILDCVLVVLEQLPALYDLSILLKQKKDETGEEVNQLMNINETKLYLHVLENILPKLNELNLFLQKEEIVIHRQQEMIEATY